MSESKSKENKETKKEEGLFPNSFRTADFPEHPDSVIIKKQDLLFNGPSLLEVDCFNYYEGIKNDLLKEIKGKNIFIRLMTKHGPIFIRHPFKEGGGDYIHINSLNDFEPYHTGRIIEFHTTMEKECNYYIIDYDAVGEWKNIKKNTLDITDHLKEKPDVKTVEIRYSGKRGFHVLGFMKKSKDINQAREELRDWLKKGYADHKDLVVQESPDKGKGALGLTSMRANAGNVSKYSLRITGLCCIDVPRNDLEKFEKSDASIDKVYKKLTGKNFVFGETRKTARRIVNSFLNDIK